jgi:hypothetical protein
MGELKCDTDTGEMFIGITALGLVRIYDGVSVRISTLGIGYVMVRDDEIQAVFFCPGDRLKTPDAAIDTDDDLASTGFRLFKRRDVDDVAFGKTDGYVEI